MKQIHKLVTVIALMVFMACGGGSDPMSKIRANAEENLKKNLDDPGSYEFVSLTMLDTNTYAENIAETKKIHEMFLSYAQIDLKSQTGYKESASFLYDSTTLSKAQADVAKENAALQSLDSIANGLGKEGDGHAAYLLAYQFRAKNKLGALVLHDYFLQVGPAPEYKFLNLAGDRGKVHNAPNGFPGKDKISVQH